MSKFSKLRAAADRVRSRSNNDNDTELWFIPPGKSTIRILPAPKGSDPADFILATGCHYSVGSAKMLMCPNKTESVLSNSCPICAHVEDLLASNYEQDNKIGKRMRVKERWAFNILVRDEEGGMKPKVLLAQPTVIQAIDAIFADEDTFGDVLHIQKGRDLILNRTGTGMDTKYSVMPVPRTSAIANTKEEAMAIMASLRPLSEQITCLDDEKLYSILFGGASDGGSASKAAPKKEYTPKSSSVDWEDDDSDDDEPSWDSGADSVPAFSSDEAEEEDDNTFDDDDDSWEDASMPAPPEEPPSAEDEDALIREKLTKRARRASA